MSAIRLPRTSKGVEIRVDDETPISDEPISLQVLPGSEAPQTYLEFSVDEATEIRDALTRAIDDAKAWKASER